MSGLETGGEADEMQLDAPTILVDLVIQGVPSAIREKIRGPGPGVEAPHSLADGAAGFGLAGRQVRRGPRHAPHHQQLTRRHGLTPPGPGQALQDVLLYRLVPRVLCWIFLKIGLMNRFSQDLLPPPPPSTPSQENLPFLP